MGQGQGWGKINTEAVWESFYEPRTQKESREWGEVGCIVGLHEDEDSSKQDY